MSWGDFFKRRRNKRSCIGNLFYDDSFCRVTVYILTYEVIYVSAVNVYDVLRGWIAAYKIEDLGELLEQCEEHREFEVENIGKVLGMFNYQD